MTKSGLYDFRTGFTMHNVIALLFGGLLLVFGTYMHEGWRLRRAEVALPQVRESFTLMLPHLNTLLNAFPERTPTIIAPTIHDGDYNPLRLFYFVLVPGTLNENHYRYNYDEWYGLDWFSQEAVDAAVFLTSSPYLSHTLSEIQIEPFGRGSSTLIANVDLGMNYVVTMVIFRDRPYSRPADARVHHREELGNGYYLRIQVYMLSPTLGRFIIGFGVIVLIVGGISSGYATSRRKKLVQVQIAENNFIS